MAPSRRVEFFGSPLCPRCRLARRALRSLAHQYPELDIVEIDPLRQPRYTLQRGIRLIPAIRNEQQQIQAILLGADRIKDFLDQSRALGKHTP
jgi:arsenate reductase-like glutaredoxin family protein